MAYATLAQLQAHCGASELVDLTDRTGSGVLDEALLTQVQASADGRIDSYLGRRYTVPVTTSTDPSLPWLSAALTRYQLWKDEAPERVRQDYEDAMALLRDVAAGRADIAGAAPPAAGSPAEGLVLMESADSLWQRGGGGYL